MTCASGIFERDLTRGFYQAVLGTRVLHAKFAWGPMAAIFLYFSYSFAALNTNFVKTPSLAGGAIDQRQEGWKLVEAVLLACMQGSKTPNRPS